MKKKDLCFVFKDVIVKNGRVSKRKVPASPASETKMRTRKKKYYNGITETEVHYGELT